MKSQYTGQEINLLVPVRDVLVTQPFGANYLGWYKQWGLNGHNGLDFRAKNGCPIIASHSGSVTFAGEDKDGGIMIEIISARKGQGIKSLYYHLKSINVAVNESVVAGQLIGWADNTGKYTTGDHLHMGLKETLNGNTLNYGNGFKGSIDPAPYFPKNWENPPAYHRYGRKGNALADFWFRFTPLGIRNQWADSGRYVQRQLKARKLPLFNTEQVNAILYGGWDFETVINPAMREIYAYLTKAEFQNGRRAFE